MMALLDHIIGILNFDPFTYLVVTIFGIAVWIWSSVVVSMALTGRGLWLRRMALVVAAAGALLFAYTSPALK